MKDWFYVLAGLLLLALGLVGWVNNLYEIAQAEVIDKFVMLRIAGAIALPFGAVLGWF